MKKDGSYTDEHPDRTYARKHKQKLAVVTDATFFKREIEDQFGVVHKIRFAKAGDVEYICIWDARFVFDYNMHESAANNNVEVLVDGNPWDKVLRFIHVPTMIDRHEKLFKQPSVNFLYVLIPWAKRGFSEGNKLMKKPVVRKPEKDLSGLDPYQVFHLTIIEMYKTCLRDGAHKDKLLMWIEKAEKDFKEALAAADEYALA